MLKLTDRSNQNKSFVSTIQMWFFCYYSLLRITLLPIPKDQWIFFKRYFYFTSIPSFFWIVVINKKFSYNFVLNYFYSSDVKCRDNTWIVLRIFRYLLITISLRSIITASTSTAASGGGYLQARSLCKCLGAQSGMETL